MYNMGKTVNVLHAMLKLHEQTLPKTNAPALNVIRAGKVLKCNKHKKLQSQKATRGQNHRKGKNKQSYALKPKIPPPPKREDPAKDSICHEYGEIGHQKRNCPQYLAELLKKKKNAASEAGGSGIFVIELNTILNRSWIYDTGCGTHICNTTQGLRASMKLNPRALRFYVGNGQREAVEAIGAFYLCLPSGLEIVLNNFHYAPSITRGVIFVSRLYEDGFVNHFVDNTIQVSRNDVDYFSAILRDGIFEIDFSNSLTNESSICTVSNKRAKLDLDSALLWHCRLGHVSKKRIENLQHDRLLDSSGLEAFEKCVSCMSRKMARKPYTHQVEMAKDLLGQIYIDHKHEMFETFIVFQKEVENQLGKTIKSLRSDCGGEYMSQEFLEHLKDHGIITHRTPPYTPQHNGVSERRNRTLLDMVRSMMSQTTLLKSFWDYALETAARILNMVPTKKILVELPPNGKTVSSKWLFKKKIVMDGNVHTYKARLVANGYTQTPGIDYEETFSPVADIRAIRILIAIAGYYDYEIWQMDVKTVFLNGYLKGDLDEAAYILRIKIYQDRSRRLISLCQSAYIEKILKQYCMENSKRESIPMQEKLKLSKSQGASTPAELKRMQNVPYDSATADKNILKYLRNTKDMFLVYGGGLKRELRVFVYTDAGYLTDADDLKSQTGYVFILNGGAVDWKSATQSIFATSFAEAEYVTAFDAAKEAVWVKKFISRLGVASTIEEPISMYCDNNGAIAIANESGITKGARHFCAKVHYLREIIEYGDIKLKKVHTDDNLADPFTKALAFSKHSKHTRNIRMLPASSLM
nr:hypothetical protein [Tanacetum cinerariifolium]